ncbi:uncharacterized protein LOC113316049 [Papaver somniferum]|uniref:uncharacterized protein LOC113316049 n=1 Tax=Papaver somniferum TaxID=3469 RepID=UPI000E6FEF4B|nr:uncharacterized protein LOC113316049 [Papaver somniferum]
MCLSDEDPSDIDKLNLMRTVAVEVNDIRMQQITMLKQKSRNQWLIEGGSNSSFFHNSICIRMSSNTISELVDANGVTLTDCDQIHNLIVDYYEAKFNGDDSVPVEALFNIDHNSISLEESTRMDQLPSLEEIRASVFDLDADSAPGPDGISLEESTRMDQLPSLEEIRASVFDLDADSAPGPDGFDGFFYRHCWEIIRDDLVNAIIFCWSNKFIPHGVNSSLLMLLPKERGENTLRNFRPIGLSNLFFKIFTKILATRLGGVLDNLISEEQVAFMKGKNIHENISLASEMVNGTQIKRKDGNVGLKLDITQAFDTVSWTFILEVFRRYGFSESWCDWILQILKSARILVLVNGSPEGFFSIGRGLRQGDPLSPIIFVLIEDVLRRNITKLFKEGKMTHMVNRKGIAPTHLFFADDIMIFCKDNMKSLRNLVDLLGLYQRASGQTISREKSKLYFGGGSLNRRATISQFLGMPIAGFPDRYLGVKLIPGAVKYHHVANAVEKIKEQLAGWKGRMLSFQDRVVLVKSVIASYSIQNMAVYKWPRKFIHECEAAIRNFLWSGDSKVSRSFVVAYDKICAPYEEGGLGLTQLSVMNKALLMSLWWKSYDVWLGDVAIAELLEDYELDHTVLVGDMLNDGGWNLSEECRNTLLAAGFIEEDLPMPLNRVDRRVWKPNYAGSFTVSSAKSLIRTKYAKLQGVNLLWRPAVHPALAARNWKILRGACATLDKVRSRFKIQVVNKCCLCNRDEETLDHLMWHCDFAVKAWSWIYDIFTMHSHLNLCTTYKAARGRSGIIKELWLVTVLVVRSELWMTRNKFVYENKKDCWSFIQKSVFNQVMEYSRRIKGYMYNTVEDLRVLDFFKVSHTKVKTLEPVECRWSTPDFGELLLCSDGAARGNPGVAGAGFVARDHEANVVGAMSIGLGITSNYLVELFGIIIGLEWAVQ